MTNSYTQAVAQAPTQTQTNRFNLAGRMEFLPQHPSRLEQRFIDGTLGSYETTTMLIYYWQVSSDPIGMGLELCKKLGKYYRQVAETQQTRFNLAECLYRLYDMLDKGTIEELGGATRPGRAVAVSGDTGASA